MNFQNYFLIIQFKFLHAGHVLRPGDPSAHFFTWWNFLQNSCGLVPPPRHCRDTLQCICLTLRRDTCRRLYRNTFSKHSLDPRPLVFLPWGESPIWDVSYRPVQIGIGGSKVVFVHIHGIDYPYCEWKQMLKEKKKFIGEVSGVVSELSWVCMGLCRGGISLSRTLPRNWNPLSVFSTAEKCPCA